MTPLSSHKQFLGILISFALLMPIALYASTVSAGLLKDQLWFSKDPFFAGDTITIFTLVYNSSSYRLSGTMTLYDGTSTIDTKPFLVDAKGGSQVVTFPWLATHGSHSFAAVITQDEFTQSTEVEKNALITATRTLRVLRFADNDKNGNGIGDSTEPPPAPVVPQPATHPQPSLVTDTSAVRSTEQTLLENVPTPVVGAAVPILGALEDFRVTEAKRAQKNVALAEEKIDPQSGASGEKAWSTLLNGATSGEVVKTPLKHVQLFFELIIRFLTSNPLAFYLVLLFLLYMLARILIRWFF